MDLKICFAFPEFREVDDLMTLEVYEGLKKKYDSHKELVAELNLRPAFCRCDNCNKVELLYVPA
jgi:hypothetical protein